ENGAKVVGIVGYRSRDLVFWREKFAKVCDDLIVCTNDGSMGMRGLVTDGLAKALDKHPDIEEVIAIGPPVMMKACAELTRPKKIHTVVSVNPIMVDGTGMCGGCRVKVGGKVRFACVDGPDFDGHLVDFDDLMMRLRRFTEEEHAALERWSEQCRMREAPAEEPLELPDPAEEVGGG
ncbi:MAG TPA: hypothetical protein VFP36_06935, partial [Usitatibacter sp.]|nr:hypothetical protein [Usitatibacter sp.]